MLIIMLIAHKRTLAREWGDQLESESNSLKNNGRPILEIKPQKK